MATAASLLSIRDDGVGMTEVREGSLGFGLVRSLVKQIGAELVLHHEGGLTACILFKYD